jgi:23S rRNA (adenine2503-C2)-methyltransferase
LGWILYIQVHQEEVNMDKIDAGSLFPEELASLCSDLGEPAFRGRQIFKWIHQMNACSFSEMTDIPKGLRQRLEEGPALSTAPKVLEKHCAKDDQTTKYLLELGQAAIIESVTMAYRYGLTACVSTQAGCAMGCAFCASALGGLDRSLSAGEMCGQVYAMQRDLQKRISRVVLMGSGEPLANYSSSVRFIRLLSSPHGANISQRRISLSTCGLPEGIERLSGEGLQVTLAVSLHASNDDARARLMPLAATACSIKELTGVCRRFSNVTKRRVSYEYAMIKGVNDSHADALQLSRLLAGELCHVNLIPLNGVSAFEASPAKAISAFASVLEANGVAATVRRSLGSGVSAACGQLRSRRL